MHTIIVEIRVEPIITEEHWSCVCCIFWVLLEINLHKEDKTSEATELKTFHLLTFNLTG